LKQEEGKVNIVGLKIDENMDAFHSEENYVNYLNVDSENQLEETFMHQSIKEWND